MLIEKGLRTLNESYHGGGMKFGVVYGRRRTALALIQSLLLTSLLASSSELISSVRPVRISLSSREAPLGRRR